MNRRGLLVMAAGVVSLPSCSTPHHDPSRTDARTASPLPSGEPSPSPASSIPVGSALHLPTDQEIVARFAERKPRAWGMDIPGIITHTDHSGVALTFDACGGPHGSKFDAALISTLRKFSIPATLFLNRRWIEANVSVARELAADPLFALANHGTRHCPLSVTGRAAYHIPGTASVVEAWHEVRDNHLYMEDILGVSPEFFRSGTAHYDDVAIEVASVSGEYIAGFSINADAGATASTAQIERELHRARSGDIVIAHMNQPGGQTAEGFAAALPLLLDGGVQFIQVPG